MAAHLCCVGENEISDLGVKVQGQKCLMPKKVRIFM